MKSTININKNELKKTFKRLKKNTSNFSRLILRDPLDFLDFEVNLDKNLDLLIYEINTNNYNPQKPSLHLYPKNKGINRPTVVFDINDALVYRFCIEQIEDNLIDKTRKENIRGGFKITTIKNIHGDSYYEKWFEEWMQFQEDLENALKSNNTLVNTDIASYFENINILILKDLVRSDVRCDEEDRKSILNLLFYFLENTRFRFDYELNTFIGLPQEDIDCSRILAYYFLNRHDERMKEFCSNYEAEYYRWIDDMYFVVKDESTGKKALKDTTESLRKLNLVASIEKTAIYPQKEARLQLFFDENDFLDKQEEKIIEKIKSNKTIEEEIVAIKNTYSGVHP